MYYMNDSNNRSIAGGGVGIGGLLGIAFVILKLCKVIDWPWIWVLAPFWITAAITIILIIIAVILLIRQ